MKCFYHNDMDGRCAGAIVARHEITHNEDFRINKKDFYEVDYLIDLTPYLKKIECGEKVYFVDYSFTEKTKWVLDLLMNKDCDIIWCDHHKSSLELIEKFPDLKYINGIRDDNYSGALNTYWYLYLRNEYFVNNKDFLDRIPMFIRYVDDYDCWKFNLGEKTTYFKLGIETVNYDALDKIWNNFNIFPETLGIILTTGKAIKQYVDMDNKQYRNQYAYESIIGGYKALIVNRKTNSWIFGEKIKEYPIVCVWAFNGNDFSYSVFSEDKSVDCSKIAESYGGGGHKGAAGFSSKELLFKAK